MRHISSYQALLKHHVDLKVYVYLTTYSGVPEWVYTYKLLFLRHIFSTLCPRFSVQIIILFPSWSFRSRRLCITASGPESQGHFSLNNK